MKGELLEKTLKRIKPLNEKTMEAAKRRQNSLIKPQGSLGRLEELSIRLAGIKGEERPGIQIKTIITMAGDHGVVAEGVSPYPQEVTTQMIPNFLEGKAGINVLAKHIGARVILVDMGVAAELKPHPRLISIKIAFGTQNIALGPAMSREEALKALEIGIEIAETEIHQGLDIVGIGDMGIGNTTPSSAICALITGELVEKVTGRGTGVSDEGLQHKIEVVKKALEINRPDPEDGLDILAKVGGFEIAGSAGVMLGAAAHRIPVVLDGFISGASALIAAKLCPKVKEYFIASHLSAERGHRILLEYLGLKPFLELEMRLGEGTGAALGIFLAEAAVKTLNEMATFAEAGVSEAAGKESR